MGCRDKPGNDRKWGWRTGLLAYYVYMLASRRHGTLYIGVTNDLARRAWEHRTKAVKGFTAKHNVTQLMWYELHDSIEAAIQREKTMKKWPRQWKLNLIERENADWTDLFETLNR